MAKSNNVNHPSRRQLVDFIEQKQNHIAFHLASCDDCRLLLTTLRATQNLSHSDKESARLEPLIQRLASLPSAHNGPIGKPAVAAVRSDSWQSEVRAQLRHAAHGIERRLTFSSGQITINLVADRLGDRWECAMRISRRGEPLTSFAARCDGHTMLPTDIGFFSWLASRPPRQIALWSPEQHLSLETITW